MARFAVMGLGRFGTKLARLLAKRGAEVIAVDKDPNLVQEVRDEVTLAVRMDCTDEQALLDHGIDKVDCAVVGVGLDFEASVLATDTLKKIGVPRVIARAGSEIRGEILRRVGADGVVFPEDESAARWANRLMLPQFEDFVELDEEHSLVQVPAPPEFVNKTPRQLELRSKYRLNLVAIRRPVANSNGAAATPKRWHVVAVPDPDAPIQPGDVLILIGSNDSLARLPRE
jgi:trk system potassium uptake protein TrkA